MAIAKRRAGPLRWDGKRLTIIDRTLLPAQERWIELTGAADTAEAIRRLAVRDAPDIGVAAAYGLAMEVARRPGLGTLERGADELLASRPDAAELARAIERVRAACLRGSVATMAAAARAEAQTIHAEEEAARAGAAPDGTIVVEIL